MRLLAWVMASHCQQLSIPRQPMLLVLSVLQVRPAPQLSLSPRWTLDWTSTCWWSLHSPVSWLVMFEIQPCHFSHDFESLRILMLIFYFTLLMLTTRLVGKLFIFGRVVRVFMLWCIRSELLSSSQCFIFVVDILLVVFICCEPFSLLAVSFLSTGVYCGLSRVENIVFFYGPLIVTCSLWASWVHPYDRVLYLGVSAFFAFHGLFMAGVSRYPIRNNKVKYIHMDCIFEWL